MRFSAILMLAIAPTSAVSIAASSSPLTPQEQAEVRRAVGLKLKDAESARYQLPTPIGTDKVIVFCGQVNAKNSYGGYSGFTQFFSLLERGPKPSASSVSIAGSDATSAYVVKSLCETGGY